MVLYGVHTQVDHEHVYGYDEDGNYSGGVGEHLVDRWEVKVSETN